MKNYDNFKINKYFKAFYKYHVFPILILTSISLFFLSYFINYTELSTHIQDFADANYIATVISTNCDKFIHNPLSFFEFTTYAMYGIENNLCHIDHLFNISLLITPIHFIFNNPILDFNIALILIFISNAIGMYFLCYYITKNRYASILGGIIFGCSPQMLWYIYAAHFNVIIFGFLPFAIIFYMKYYDTGNSKYLLLFSLFLLFQMLSRWYIVIFSFIIFSIFFLYTISLKFDLKKICYIILVLLLIVLCLIPFYIPYKKYYEEVLLFPISKQLKLSASYTSYLLPPIFEPTQTLFGGILLDKFNIDRATNTSSWRNSHFIGYFVLLMLLLYIPYIYKKGIFSRKLIMLCYFGIIVSFMLSLGFVIYINNTPTDYKLPWYFVYKYILPLRFIRSLSQFAIIVHFFAAILFSMAYTQLFTKIDSSKKTLRILILFLFISILTYEYLPTQKNSKRIKFEVPEIYNYIKNNKDIKAFLELPIIMRSDKYMMYSNYHKKYVYGGPVDGHRTFKKYDYDHILPEIYNGVAFDLMKELNINYILIHKKDFLKDNDNLTNKYFSVIKETQNEILFKTNSEFSKVDLKEYFYKKRIRYFNENINNKDYFLIYNNDKNSDTKILLLDENNDVSHFLKKGNEYDFGFKSFSQNMPISYNLIIPVPIFNALTIKDIEINYKYENLFNSNLASSFFWGKDQDYKYQGKFIAFNLIGDGSEQIKKISLKDYPNWLPGNNLSYIGLSIPVELEGKFELISIKMANNNKDFVVTDQDYKKEDNKTIPYAKFGNDLELLEFKTEKPYYRSNEKATCILKWKFLNNDISQKYNMSFKTNYSNKELNNLGIIHISNQKDYMVLEHKIQFEVPDGIDDDFCEIEIQISDELSTSPLKIKKNREEFLKDNTTYRLGLFFVPKEDLNGNYNIQNEYFSKALTFLSNKKDYNEYLKGIRIIDQLNEIKDKEINFDEIYNVLKMDRNVEKLNMQKEINKEYDNLISLLGFSVYKINNLDNKYMVIELYWKKLGEIKDNYSIFFHIEQQENKVKKINLDHELLKGSYNFVDASKDQIIKESIVILLDDKFIGGNYNFNIGLVNKDNARAKLTNSKSHLVFKYNIKK